MTYTDICMTNIKHVLIFNPNYSSGGTSVPTQSDIVLNGVVSTDSESGAYSIFEGFDAANPLQIALENIDLDNVTQDGNHGNEGPTEGESPTEYVNAYTYDTNIVPAGPEGDTANDVTSPRSRAPAPIPTCDIPAFGPPPALGGGPGLARVQAIGTPHRRGARQLAACSPANTRRGNHRADNDSRVPTMLPGRQQSANDAARVGRLGTLGLGMPRARPVRRVRTGCGGCCRGGGPVPRARTGRARPVPARSASSISRPISFSSARPRSVRNSSTSRRSRSCGARRSRPAASIRAAARVTVGVARPRRLAISPGARPSSAHRVSRMYC